MKPLPPGGTIGVAAPASPYDSRSEILRGVEWWESQGYRVKLADGVYERDDYVAGDAEQRAADLNALFADPEVDVVQALQGGYGSAQTIPYLDFDAIARQPEAARRLLRHHGAPRRRRAPHRAADDLRERPRRRRRSRGNRVHARAARPGPDRRRDRPGPAESRRPVRARDPRRRGERAAPRWLPLAAHADDGHALGGRARRRDPLLRGRTRPPPYYVDGALTQLKHAGKLDRVVGVVVGEMKDCDWGDLRQASDWARSRSLEDVLEEHLEPLGVPGHLRPAARPRQAPGRPSARRSVYARRRLSLTDGRRVAVRRVSFSRRRTWARG